MRKAQIAVYDDRDHVKGWRYRDILDESDTTIDDTPFDVGDEIWPRGVSFSGGRGAIVFDNEIQDAPWCPTGLVRAMNEAGTIFGANKRTHYVIEKFRVE